QVANLDLLDREFNLLLSALNPGGIRPQSLQCLNGRGGLAFGTAFQPFTQEHQRDHYGRGFKVIVGMGGIAEQLVDAQAVSRTGSQGYRQVHVAAAGFKGTPASAVEAPAEPELDGRGEQELDPARQHPVDPKDHQYHWRYQGQG